MRWIVYGLGNFYDEHRALLHECVKREELVAFVDKKWQEKRTKYGKKVYSLEYLKKFDFDGIVLMSVHEFEMKQDLYSMGIDRSKIYTWKHFLRINNKQIVQVYDNGSDIFEQEILILVHDLGFHGGAMVASYAALALQSDKVKVTIAALDGKREFVDGLLEKGMAVIIDPTLLYFGKSELHKLDKYECIIAVCFPMLPFICTVNNYKPSIFWVHENNNKYEHCFEMTLEMFDWCNDISIIKSLNIHAVSEIAKRNFEELFPNTVKGILNFGIPKETCIDNKNRTELTFALIGVIYPRKAQDIYIKAIKKLDKKIRNKARFLIIGKIADYEYYNELIEISRGLKEIVWEDELTHEDMMKKYGDIDVVVCPSLEETMSIVVVEGMMLGKVCITSDTAGVSTYIKQGVNGFVVKSGDIDDLKEKMTNIINKHMDLNMISNNAIATYNENFPISKMKKKICEIMSVEKNY